MKHTRSGKPVVVVAASMMVVLLSACTSTNPTASPDPTGVPPTATGQATVPQQTSAPNATSADNSLPDPGQGSDGVSLEAQHAATVANTAGSGREVISLPPLPVDSTHVVVRLVCAGSADAEVVDGNGRMLLRGSCEALNGSSIDLPELESSDYTEVSVRMTDGSPWRLYVGTY